MSHVLLIFCHAHLGDTVINRGRIVVVTALEGDNRYKELLEAVEDQLTKINEEAAQVRQVTNKTRSFLQLTNGSRRARELTNGGR